MRKIINIVLNNFINDSRVYKTSATLCGLGLDVEVVALHQEGLFQNETMEGFKVSRLKILFKKLPKIKPIQIFKYLEFLLRAIFKYRNQVDFIHCNDLSALPIGFLLKRFSTRDVKIIYDCHEYETERDGMSGLSKKALKFFEGYLIKNADAVLTVSNAIADCYSQDYAIKKPALVLNCPEFFDKKKQNLFREKLNIREDQKIFLYQGGLKGGRGIELLLEAFSGLHSDENVLVCMGYGPLEALIREKASQQNTIFFHPAVSPDVLLNYTSSADYGILFYEDTCLNHRYCSPNKIFEYLMAGLPVLTSNLYEIKRLVEAEGVGIVARENTVVGFRQAVVDSLEQDYQLIQKNVFLARRKFCWEEQEKELKAIYESI